MPPHFRRQTMFPLLVAVAVSCGSADAGGLPLLQPPPTGSWTTEEGCDESLSERLNETARSAVAFDQQRSHEQFLEDRHAWGEALRDLAALDIAEPFLSTLIRLEEQVTEVAGELWGADGTSLADSADSAGVDVMALLLDSLAPESDRWTPDEVSALRIWVLESFALTCMEAPNGWMALSNDTSLALPAGLLTAWSLETGAREVWSLPLLDDATNLIDAGTFVQASPDGRMVLFRRGEDELWTQPADASTPAVRFDEGAADLGCATWTPDSTAVTVSMTTAETTQLVRLDVGTDETTVLQSTLDDAIKGCVVQVDDTRLLVVTVVERTFEVWLTALNGEPRQLLLRSDDCTIFPLSPARPGPQVTLTARCSDFHQSGLWELDLAEQTLTHIVTGTAGVHSWSPDGRWLAFARFPIPHFPQEVSVWITDTETGHSRQVTPPQFSYPLLLKD